MFTDKVVISIAANDDELLEAYKLRFRVFSLEKGDFRYANTEEKTYKDPWDVSKSKVLIAKNEYSEVIGTLRLSFRKDGAYLGDEAYGYDVLANKLCTSTQWILDNAAIISRGVIAQNYRDKGIFKQLLEAFDSLCEENGVNLIIGSITVGNEESKNILIKNGYCSYGVRVNNSGWNGEYIYKLLGTIDENAK